MNMRKIIAVLAAVLMLCAVIPMGALSVSAADNLVPNGTFDSNTSGWGKSTNTVLTLDNGAMKATHADDWAYVYTWFDVTANTDYTISFKAKADKGGFAINFKDNGWAATGIAKLSPAITTEWKEYEMNFNTGSFSGRLLVFFSSNQYGSANQSIWLDDVSVTKYIPLGTAIYEENFEDGDMGAWGNTVTTLVPASELPVANPNGGNYAIKLASTNYSYTNTTVTLEKNTYYKATFSILSGSDRNPVNVRMRSSSSVDAGLYSCTPSTGAWETHSFVFNSGDFTSLYFRFQAGWKTSVFYIDNLSVVTCAAPSFDGYITNGDFETGDMTGWTVTSAKVTDSVVAGGSYALQGTATAKYGNSVHQIVNVQANTNYGIIFKAKGAASGAQARLYAGTGTGNTGAKNSTYYWSVSPDAWTTCSTTFNSGDATSLYINLCQGVANGGDIYYDDILMYEIKDPSFDGYLYNGDFECGTHTNWSKGSQTVVDTDSAYTGNFGVHLKGNSASWGGVLNQTINGLEIGATYHISFWYKAVQQGINYKLSGVNSATTFAYKYMSTKAWTKIDADFVADDTSAKLNFSCSGIDSSKATYEAGIDEMYVDDIVITLVKCATCVSDSAACVDGTCTKCGNPVAASADHTYANDYDADCNVCGAIRAVVNPIAFGGNSRSEDVSGLAFKFDVAVDGMTVNGTEAIYDGATIDGNKLISMGAIVSNAKSELDIPAVYLCDLEADSASFAVRVINIPEANYGDEITAVPYFVVEIDGVETTVYGEAQVASYNG